MKFDEVAAALQGVPFMSQDEGRRVYDHLCATGAKEVLEIGTAHGVSAAYMAAALDENGAGGVTTLDSSAVHRDPGPAEVLSRAGLEHLVRLVRVEDSSYTWWLKDQVTANSDQAGNCSPIYDFCYLDGAHNWTIDGLAVVLIERLLRNNGWLLLDDLYWTYASGSTSPGQGAADLRLSSAERSTPHIAAVFNLIVRQHPSFSRFVEEDQWGWAQKAIDQPRTYELVTSSSLTAQAIRALRRTKSAIDARRSRPRDRD